MEFCKKCGRPLEVTHFVLGKIRTHPCACSCMITAFENGLNRKKSERFQNLQQEAATYGRRPEAQG